MSSLLPGNPFAVMANDALGCTPVSAEDQLNLNTSAASNATLALAYEQRTATLVHALLSDSLVTDGKYDELQAEVRQRLGIGEDNA